MRAKRLQANLKAVGEGGYGSWKAVASAPSVDRDNEIVDAFAFEPLPPSVPVHAEHGGEIVGSGRPYYEAGVLYIDGEFASTPKAQMIRSLVREGHLRTMSVAFLPSRKSQGSPRHIEKAELLAVDWASIPSNRDALVLAAKASPDPAALAQGMDAVLDELAGALEMNNVAAAMALVTAAQATADSLLVALGAADANSPDDFTTPKGANRMTSTDDLYLRAKRLQFSAIHAILDAESVADSSKAADSRSLLNKQIAWARAHVQQKADWQRQLSVEKGQTNMATLSPFLPPVRCSVLDPERDPDLPPPGSYTGIVHRSEIQRDPEPAGFGTPAGTRVTYGVEPSSFPNIEA